MDLSAGVAAAADGEGGVVVAAAVDAVVYNHRNRTMEEGKRKMTVQRRRWRISLACRRPLVPTEDWVEHFHSERRHDGRADALPTE